MAAFLHRNNFMADKIHLCCQDCRFDIRKLNVQNLLTRGQIVPDMKTHNCMECRKFGTYLYKIFFSILRYRLDLFILFSKDLILYQ